MSRRFLLALIAASLSIACFAGLGLADELKPSRSPEKGCKWTPFESASLGVRLLVQDCANPDMHYVFSTKQRWIEQHRPSDDVTFGGPRVLRVFSKKADESLEAAIRSQIIARMKSPQKESCKVAPSKDGPKLEGNKVAVEIVPSITHLKAARSFSSSSTGWTRRSSTKTA